MKHQLNQLSKNTKQTIHHYFNIQKKIIMRELTIRLPETLVDENLPYRILANNLLEINLTFYAAHDEPKTESIVFPLPEPKGMWLVKNITRQLLTLLDV